MILVYNIFSVACISSQVSITRLAGASRKANSASERAIKKILYTKITMGDRHYVCHLFLHFTLGKSLQGTRLTKKSKI